MQRVKYIYSGSSTRKLQVSGRQSVVISGDSDSTVFDFTFPKEYKSYSKTIIWDCYCENKDGDIINPRYPIKNDAFTVPYEITANNAGLQISFVVSLVSPTGFIETSLPTPVYITRSTHTDKCKVETDVLSQISSRAFTNAHFMLTTFEGDEPPKTYPTITFDNLSDVTVATLYLTDVPYLRDGKIPKEFISTDQIVELFTIASKDDLITLTNAVSPDMAIITEGDDAGDIYILKGESYAKPEDWTPIYSESRLKNLENTKVDKEEGKGLSSNDFTDALKTKLEGMEPDTYATKDELDKKVDKEEGKGLSSNDYTDVDKAKVDGLETTYATKVELDTKVDKVDGKGLSTEDFTTELKDKLEGMKPDTYATKTELTDGLATKVDKVDGKGLSTNDYTDVDKAKVDGLETTYATKVELDKKVDKVDGKGLSTNDYTDADKAKVDGLETTYATKTELTGGLAGKVDKVEGKGLSTKDYTAEDQAKLAGIEANAQVNIIEVVKRNGTALTITDKAVDVEVPTKVIQLEDAGDYATLSTDKLTNYYTTTVVDELIEEAKSGAKVEQTKDGIKVGQTVLQVATDDTTGLMPSTMVVQLNKATSDINTIGSQVNTQSQEIATNSGNIASLTAELGNINTEVLELKTSLDAKQDKLTQGENITIIKNESGETVISATAKPLTPATTTTLGGVIVGNKLDVTPEGTLSVSGLEIADISNLPTQLDAKASTTYVDTELAKKQNTLTATGGLSLADGVLTIEDGYVDSKLEAGANVLLTKDTDTGKLVISATGELAIGWGNISGSIHAQTDLVSKSILTWNADTTYAQNGMVIYSGKIYTSLVNGNVGKTPSTSPGAWKVLDTESAKPTVFTQTIGDGTSSEITVKHDLNSKDVLVALRKIDGTFVDALITAISVNEVKFSFNTPPAIDSLVAIIALGAGGSSGTTVVEGFEGITWTTDTAQNTWEISLAETFGDIPRPNRLLNVQTYDENGTAIIGKVTQTKDIVTVGFNRAIKGTAVLN